MNLQNPFSEKTRWLFYDVQYHCWLCRTNGQESGGTELHHIVGRSSNSPYNASVLCVGCHKGMNHNEEEEQNLLRITSNYLEAIGYVPNDKDKEFIKLWQRNKHSS